MLKIGVKQTIIATSAILLSSCISAVSEVAPRTYSINCTGWPMTIQNCYNTASRYCPHGYIILSKQPVNIANITLSAQALAPNRVKIRGIIIRCK